MAKKDRRKKRSISTFDLILLLGLRRAAEVVWSIVTGLLCWRAAAGAVQVGAPHVSSVFSLLECGDRSEEED